MKQNQNLLPVDPGLGRQLLRIFRRQAILALVIALGAVLESSAIPGCLLGALAGLGDSGLMLWGIGRGMRKLPEKAAAYMHRMMFTRMAYLLCLTLLAMKAHWQPALVMLGFVCFNVMIIIQMALCHINPNLKRK